MKAKYILDECVSSKPHFHDDNFVQLVDLLGQGASDDEIFKLSKKLKMLIVTKDRAFALKILSEKNPVIYQCYEKTVLIIPKEVIQSPKLSDPIAYHLLESESVIIP